MLKRHLVIPFHNAKFDYIIAQIHLSNRQYLFHLERQTSKIYHTSYKNGFISFTYKPLILSNKSFRSSSRFNDDTDINTCLVNFAW